MGWQRPYALSSDVHQTRWTIQLWVADLADPYGPPIHTRYPSLDDWAVIPQLSGRPQGALPALDVFACRWSLAEQDGCPLSVDIVSRIAASARHPFLTVLK